MGAVDHVATRVTVAYLMAGLCWVLATDVVLHYLVNDPTLAARLETAKGWSFVAFSALCVFLITARQVKRLSRLRETTRAIVESMADGVMLVGRDRRVAGVNPAVVRMLGLENKEELIGMDAEEFSRRFHLMYHDGRIVPPHEYISQRALAGEATAPMRASLRVDDDTLFITITASPVRVPGGDVDLAVSVIRDITLMERFDRLRDTFFSTAAHALKTPIATVKAHAQLLASSDDRRTQVCAKAIDRQTQRMDLLVENLLVLARLRDGTLRLHPHELNLAPLVAEVISDMRTSCPGHALVEAIDAHPVVFGDGQRLAQAFGNLIEVAGRESVRTSDITVLLSRRDGHARFGVRFAPLSDTTGKALGWEYSLLSIERHVSDALAKAHAGTFLCEYAGDGTITLWVDLPAIGEEHGGWA